ARIAVVACPSQPARAALRRARQRCHHPRNDTMKADPSKPDLPIRPDRVVELIDAYGADPLRWPDAERSAAEQALWNSPQLRQHQASARELDQAIDALPLVAPAPALRERLLRAAPVVRRGPWQWLRALLGELGAPPSV